MRGREGAEAEPGDVLLGEGKCHEAGCGSSTKTRAGIGRRRGRGWAEAHVHIASR